MKKIDWDEFAEDLIRIPSRCFCCCVCLQCFWLFLALLVFAPLYGFMEFGIFAGIGGAVVCWPIAVGLLIKVVREIFS